MKVLVLTPGVFDKGGISRYGRFQIRAMREAFGDDSVRVISLMGRAPGDLEEPFQVDWAGSVPHSGLSRAHFSSVAFRLARAERPDVVLTQLMNLGPLGWMVARLGGARLAQNIYGCEIWSATTRARRAALARSDLVIADAHNSADRALEIGLVGVEPAVVWDCVDLDRLTPGEVDPRVTEQYGLPEKRRLRVMFLGRLAPEARYKGSERLIRLIAALPEERFEAVLAGQGDDVASLRALARELGVENRVFLPGAIREEHLTEIFRSADAFFLVSEVGENRGEGLPLTPIEAMACGVPVLVGDQDGSREILDGRGGLCSSPDDLDRQRDYLTRLAGSAEFLQAEGDAARSRAVSVFGYEAFAKKTVAALRTVMPGGEPPARGR